MALKADRDVQAVEIGFYLNAVASKGVIVSTSTGASGVGLDNAAALATVSASSSGADPIGMLLNDVVNLDLTRTPQNLHKDEVQIGSKVTIMNKGWAVTNQITGTPTVGAIAVLSSSGTVTPITATTWTQDVNPYVGKFRTIADENGYARVYVDL